MIRSVRELSPDQKSVIESLLGRPVGAEENISVRAIEPPALTEEQRRELAEQLKKYFAEVDAARAPGSPEEAEEIITEAMRSVRPGFRPHR